MKYVIMSAGQGTRWNYYNGITKQEAVIDNESLLQRIVRQIKERTSDQIVILSDNVNHFIQGCDLLKPFYSDYYRSKYAYELIDSEMTYLYGDTYYSDEVIEKIINTQVEDVMFFGNTASIVGAKVKDYQLFKEVISNYTGDGSLYHAFDNLSVNGNIPERFGYIGNEVYNINKPEDYENLYTITSELTANNNLISIGIIWNVGATWSDEILKQIAEIYSIDYSQKIVADDYYDFLKRIYRGDLSEETINRKYVSMINSGNSATVFQIKIPNPQFKIQTQKGSIACEQISSLKKQIRGIYKPLVNNNSYDNIIHMTDTPIEAAKTMKIISQYGVNLYSTQELQKKRRLNI
ncbi:MAG: hypothetical protein PHU94_01825 [Bacilli bacterium]|nr:hypothetical protein [Bacilli bacterium]MDD4734256.1 hypothetical protein [Bacilli bacterium]